MVADDAVWFVATVLFMDGAVVMLEVMLLSFETAGGVCSVDDKAVGDAGLGSTIAAVDVLDTDTELDAALVVVFAIVACEVPDDTWEGADCSALELAALSDVVGGSQVKFAFVGSYTPTFMGTLPLLYTTV